MVHRRGAADAEGRFETINLHTLCPSGKLREPLSETLFDQRTRNLRRLRKWNPDSRSGLPLQSTLRSQNIRGFYSELAAADNGAIFSAPGAGLSAIMSERVNVTL
jgi:hypothetical protein